MSPKRRSLASLFFLLCLITNYNNNNVFCNKIPITTTEFSSNKTYDSNNSDDDARTRRDNFKLSSIAETQQDTKLENLRFPADKLKRFKIVHPTVHRKGHPDEVLNTTETSTGHVEEISVNLYDEVTNTNYIIQLTLTKMLWSENFVIYIGNGEQIRPTFQEMKKIHCHYQGHLSGNENLNAVFSTCRGLSGHVHIGEDDTIFVEPRFFPESSQTYFFHQDHLLFHPSDLVENNFIYDTDGENPRNANDPLPISLHGNISFANKKKYKKRKIRQLGQKTSIHKPRDSSHKSRFLELYLVADHYEYVRYNKNYWEVVDRMMKIFNTVNGMYREVDVFVLLVALEIWTDGNHVTIDGAISTTLWSFINYLKGRAGEIVRFDSAQFISGIEMSTSITGKATMSSLCSPDAAGVISDHHSLVDGLASVVAHELAHNFGVNHDGEDSRCYEKNRIMSAGGSQSNPVYHWSECSKRYFSENLKIGSDICLYDFPEKLPFPSCGNGIKDADEECDCGQDRVCINKCCDPITCKFTQNATCASGDCCNTETCQVFAEGKQCRNAMGYCDLPEYCNGVSEFCPFDVFRQNGVPCGKETYEESYCYNGYCPHNDQHCRLFFGSGIRSSGRICYEQYNIEGSNAGHCGSNIVTETYEKCSLKDVMCGMIHCDASQEDKLVYWHHHYIKWHPYSAARDKFNGFVQHCRGFVGYVGGRDIGMVHDGTKCAENAICVDRKCTNISLLNFPNCPDCHGHGVCNSLGQCHCDPGWAPPHCNVRGTGGSPHARGNGSESSSGSQIAITVAVTIVILVIIIVISVLAWKRKESVKEFGTSQWRYFHSLFRRFATKNSQSNVSNSQPNTSSKTPQTNLLRANSNSRKLGSNLNRIPSFRPEDIGKPLLQSSTNNSLTPAIEKATNAHQSVVPKRPKLPVSLHQSNSFSSNENAKKQDRIYANQVIRTNSFNISESQNFKKNAHPNQSEEIVLSKPISDDVSSSKMVYNEKNSESYTKVNFQKRADICKNSEPNIPKQQYENVDSIISTKIGNKMPTKANKQGPSRPPIPKNSLQTHCKTENSLLNSKSDVKVSNNSTNEYRNLPPETHIYTKPKNHSTQEQITKLPSAKTVPVCDSGTPRKTGTVSSLRDKFQSKPPEATETQKAPTRPKPTYANLKV